MLDFCPGDILKIATLSKKKREFKNHNLFRALLRDWKMPWQHHPEGCLPVNQEMLPEKTQIVASSKPSLFFEPEILITV